MVGAASNSVEDRRLQLLVDRGANPETTDANKSKRKVCNLVISLILRFEVYENWTSVRKLQSITESGDAMVW